MNSIFLILDLHNGGILHEPRSRDVMVGLLEGTLDAIPYQLFPELWSEELREQYANFDFGIDMLFLSPKDRLFHRMPEALVTDSFLERRQIAKERASYIYKLQLLCEGARETNSLGVPQEIFADIEFELQKCRPDQHEFTTAIHEYASCVGLTPAACFEDLRMKVEGGRIVRIRNFAIYRKYLDLIHSTPRHLLKKVFVDLNNELFFNSHV